MLFIPAILQSALSIPSFPRSIFFTSISLLIPLPVLAGRITTITSDRHSNTSFLDPLRGGDLISPQHSFWSLSHPEAHIPIIPAFGMISEILSKYSQCNIFGRDSYSYIQYKSFMYRIPAYTIWFNWWIIWLWFTSNIKNRINFTWFYFMSSSTI